MTAKAVPYYGWSMSTLKPRTLSKRVAFRSFTGAIYISTSSTWLLGDPIPDGGDYVITATDFHTKTQPAFSAWLIAHAERAPSRAVILRLLRAHLLKEVKPWSGITCRMVKDLQP